MVIHKLIAKPILLNYCFNLNPVSDAVLCIYAFTYSIRTCFFTVIPKNVVLGATAVFVSHGLIGNFRVEGIGFYFMCSYSGPKQPEDYECYKTIKQDIADSLSYSTLAVNSLHIIHYLLPPSHFLIIV